MQLIVIRGLPGAGKSTFAHTHYPDLMIVEADKLRMTDFMYVWKIQETQAKYKACENIVEECLKVNADCIVSNIFITRSTIEPYERLASKYGAHLQVVAVRTQFRSTHNVPEDAMQKMKLAWESYPGESIIT